MRTWLLGMALVVGLVAGAAPALADIMAAGDLTIIDDPGNPSDGLAFLDMSFSVGKTLSEALAAATAVYADARLATPDEWNDLVSAAGIPLTLLQPSDAFGADPVVTVEVGLGGQVAVLIAMLGPTSGDQIAVWSDPDGLTTGTRDYMRIRPSNNGEISMLQSNAVPANQFLGWWIVSESAGTPIPEPASLALVGLGIAGVAVHRRRRKRSTA